MSQKNVWNGFFDKLEIVCKYIAGILLAIAVVSSLIQVVSRTILGSPLTWTEEAARYSGIWMTMWAMGPVFRERGHIGVDFIYNKFPNCSKKYVDVVNDLITVAVMGLFTYFASILMTNGAGTTSPALRIPMSIVYSGVVLGGGISMLFALDAAIRHTKSNFGKAKEGE